MVEKSIPTTVYFYAQTDDFAEFSNFAPFGVAMEGQWWRTVEHFFQAQKFLDISYRERIRAANKPKDAKALGMTRRVPLREDWEEIKDQIMLDAVRVKFQTHEQPRQCCFQPELRGSWKTRRWMPIGGAARMGRD